MEVSEWVGGWVGGYTYLMMSAAFLIMNVIHPPARTPAIAAKAVQRTMSGCPSCVVMVGASLEGGGRSRRAEAP